jgi:FixJ family two-component response regulator
MKAGAVEFLVKPFSGKDLLDAIQQAIKRDQSARYQQAQMEDLWILYLQQCYQHADRRFDYGGN